MEIKKLEVDALCIIGLQALDPVQVYWEDFGKGQGRVTITCYGEAWTAYWNAMGETTTVKEFFGHCDDDYLSNRLMGAQFQKHTQGHKTYLKRIVRGIKEHLKVPLDSTPA